MSVSKIPFAYTCPRGCGCLWRDNRDSTISLYGENSKSCHHCEYMTLDEMVPLYNNYTRIPSGVVTDKLNKALNNSR